MAQDFGTVLCMYDQFRIMSQAKINCPCESNTKTQKQRLFALLNIAPPHRRLDNARSGPVDKFLKCTTCRT